MSISLFTKSESLCFLSSFVSFLFRLVMVAEEGRDSQRVWDGHGHTAVFNMENRQGPAGQHRELCSRLCNNLMVPRGKGGGRDSQGVWDGHGHTAVFNVENQQRPAGQHRELCSMSCGSLDGRGVWGRMDPCMCMAESLLLLT